jgi:biopolymer transport protein ExbB/TolQ
MSIFLLAAIALAVVLINPIIRAFQSNPALNSVILAVALFGIAYAYRQVIQIGQEAAWLDAYQRAARSSAAQPPAAPTLLAPIAKLLRSRNERSGQISTMAMRSLLDSIAARLDESRDISRYLTGLMIFLGLLGTFWGLLETVSSVGAAIGSLNVGASGDLVQMFENLKRGLEAPLTGMGIAFSSSLFGLSGSLVLGFLDLQAGQAQNRFYNDLEEWLAGMTRMTGSGPVGDGETSVPAYVQALLEQTAESLDNLQRTMARAEEGRSTQHHVQQQLAERLGLLTEQMRAEQSLLVRMTETQMELKPVLQRLAQMPESAGLDQASRGHLRNLEIYAARLVEDSSEGRNRMIEELRSEIKLLARTIAATAEDRRVR